MHILSETHYANIAKKLHWLPVSYRTEFKILIICYKALNDTSPDYLNSNCIAVSANKGIEIGQQRFN
jgi:hypothetical protein